MESIEWTEIYGKSFETQKEAYDFVDGLKLLIPDDALKLKISMRKRKFYILYKIIL